MDTFFRMKEVIIIGRLKWLLPKNLGRLLFNSPLGRDFKTSGVG